MSLGRDVPSLPTLDKLVSEVADIDGRVDRRRRARVMPDSPVSSWPLLDRPTLLPTCSVLLPLPSNSLPSSPSRTFLYSLPSSPEEEEEKSLVQHRRKELCQQREGGRRATGGRTDADGGGADEADGRTQTGRAASEQATWFPRRRKEPRERAK